MFSLTGSPETVIWEGRRGIVFIFILVITSNLFVDVVALFVFATARGEETVFAGSLHILHEGCGFADIVCDAILIGVFHEISKPRPQLVGLGVVWIH